MLSTQENELLTKVGPGTPMGEFLRRFWLPALLSDELPQADGDPVSLIAAVYASYEKGEPELSDLYSRRLQALIDKDEKETPEGMVGRIDWDVFVDSQDWKLSEL